MFEALEQSMVVLERLVAVEQRVKRQSASLADQTSRASESIALNLSEGSWRRDGDKRRHRGFAAGSAGELTTALRIAVAKGHVTSDEAARVDEPLDRVRAMLYRMTYRAVGKR